MTDHPQRSLPALAPSVLLAWAAVPALAQTVAPPVAGRTDAGTATPAGQAPADAIGRRGTAPGQPTGPFGGSGLLLMMGGFLVLMIVMQVFAGKKEKKRRADMLTSLKRHDRVQTIGGLIGSVAEVRDDEIVLKVDEATNTKVRIVRSAVQSVLKRSASPGATDDQPLEAARS